MNNALNISIIAIGTAIAFCDFVIADPTTPPNQVVKFTNYRTKLIKQQKDNTESLVANCQD